MSEATHTPGPWMVGNPIRGAAQEIFSKGVGGLRHVVARAYSWAPVNRRQIREANANLIAAAPELLEACEEFVRKCDCGEARSRRSYAQMKAAIAKAKGEQS